MKEAANMVAMPEVFISYSRTDTDFTLRLQASLAARGIEAWVDLSKLAGGQDWARKIETAIDGCKVLIVVLSPEAANSDWVLNEVARALIVHKHIVPLMRRETLVPTEIGRLQYIPFTNDDKYDQGLRELAITLNQYLAQAAPVAPNSGNTPTSLAPVTPTPTTSVVPIDMAVVDRRLVTPVPGPPPPDPDMQALYREGHAANVNGELELANVKLGQAVANEPDFRNGDAAAELTALQKPLRANRIKRLRDRAVSLTAEQRWQEVASAWQGLLDLDANDKEAQDGVLFALRQFAEQAEATADWGMEIGIWQAILKRTPADTMAQEALDVARANQESQVVYGDAVFYLGRDDAEVAKERLQTLWSKAPYYGDPAGIASNLVLTAPLTYLAALAQQNAESERKAAFDKLVSDTRTKAQQLMTVAQWELAVNEWDRLLELLPGDQVVTESRTTARNNIPPSDVARQLEELRKKAKEADTYRNFAHAANLWSEIGKLEPAESAKQEAQKLVDHYQTLAKRKQEQYQAEQASLLQKDPRKYFLTYKLFGPSWHQDEESNRAILRLSLVNLGFGLCAMAYFFVPFFPIPKIIPAFNASVETDVALSQQLLALAAVLAIGSLVHVLVYSRVLSLQSVLVPLVIGAIVSLIVYSPTLIAPDFLIHTGPYASHLWRGIGLRNDYVTNQAIPGAFGGAVSGVIALFRIFDDSPPFDGPTPKYAGCLFGSAVGFGLIWLVLALPATIFQWGWGFGYGWNIAFFAFPIGYALVVGMGVMLRVTYDVLKG